MGIATWLRAGRFGIESRWGRDFPPVQTGPGAHSASCKMGTGSFPGVKYGRGVLLTTDPLLEPRSWKNRAIPLYPPSGPHRACNGITLPLPKCVSVAVVIRRAKRMRRVTISSVACPAIRFFPYYLVDGTIFFKKKFFEPKIRVLIFSSTFVWNVCHSKKNWAGYKHKSILFYS